MTSLGNQPGNVDNFSLLLPMSVANLGGYPHDWLLTATHVSWFTSQQKCWLFSRDLPLKNPVTECSFYTQAFTCSAALYDFPPRLGCQYYHSIYSNLISGFLPFGQGKIADWTKQIRFGRGKDVETTVFARKWSYVSMQTYTVNIHPWAHRCMSKVARKKNENVCFAAGEETTGDRPKIVFVGIFLYLSATSSIHSCLRLCQRAGWRLGYLLCLWVS